MFEIHFTNYFIYCSHQMAYIGKSYNLWYKVIEQLEDISNYYEHEKKNVRF